MRFRHWLFDLDDTLFPEAQFVQQGYAAVSAELERMGAGTAPATLRRLEALHAAGVRGTTLTQICAELGLGDAAVSGMITVYRGSPRQLSLFPGVSELLAQLRARGPVGVVTDGLGAVQRLKVASLGLSDIVDAICYTDDLGREHWKPDAAGFHSIQGQLGVSADGGVYVADNPLKDFLAARRAGLQSVWARHSGGDYARLNPGVGDAAPDLVADTIPTLRALLLG